MDDVNVRSWVAQRKPKIGGISWLIDGQLFGDIASDNRVCKTVKSVRQNHGQANVGGW